jgi:phosphinothricin acetyltransferase
MGLRITDTYTKNLPWLVAVHQGQVVGYAYASAWKARSAYRFAVEVTVYVAVENLHMGVGRRLYADLLANLRQKGTQTAIAGIALPNVESEALHRNFGFEKVAHFKRVGFKLGRWIDVAYWQLGWHDKISDEDCSGSNNYSDPSGTNGNPV